MKTLPTGATIKDLDLMSKEVEKKAIDATEKFLDRRALIFIEEAIAHYNGRHGVKKTRQYLQYMLEYLHEFETEENRNV